MSIRNMIVILLIFGIGLAACAPAVTEAPVTEVQAEPTQASVLGEPTQAEEPGIVEEEAPDAEGESIFSLDLELSEARFIIGEILANAPNTVVGINNQVQGEGVLNFSEPELSTLGEFIVDSSGFVTDSSLRNRAIREFILQSGQYPAISFRPTDIAGTPSEIVLGEIVPFEIVGLLTIREITQEVTFKGEATVVTEDRVEGLATAAVLREDFKLSIPSVPRVAGVDEEFTIEIDFVAVSE